jgi:hypothetical protein
MQPAAAGGEDQVDAHAVQHAQDRFAAELSAFPEFRLIPKARAHTGALSRVDLRQPKRALGATLRRTEPLEVVDHVHTSVNGNMGRKQESLPRT